jgi:metallo-beta-lactamase family protein
MDQAVNARVENLHTFSGHADRVDLLWFMRSLEPRPRTIFLVHGDPADRIALAKHLKDNGIDRVELPEFGQRFELE